MLCVIIDIHVLLQPKGVDPTVAVALNACHAGVKAPELSYYQNNYCTPYVVDNTFTCNTINT